MGEVKSTKLTQPLGTDPLRGTISETLEFRRLEIPEIVLFRSESRSDLRGSVRPSFNARQMEDLGIVFTIHHENHCSSPARGTVRGFHYQLSPHAQAKLIRVTSGRMLDVNLDLREGSPTFRQYVSAELTPDNWSQIFVPEGFAHCYCTLEPNTEVIFKLGHPFAPEYARGLAWDDPAIGVDWPVTKKEAIVLERDLRRPALDDLTEFFPYRRPNGPVQASRDIGIISEVELPPRK